MDLFFDLFLKKADELKRRMAEREELERAERRALSDLLRAIPIMRAEGTAEGIGAAVDGGVWLVDLIDGRKMVLARAIAIGPAEMAERSFVMGVARSRSAKWSYLEAAEIKAARAAIRGGRISYLLMDGSYRARTVLRLYKILAGKTADCANAINAMYALAMLIKDAGDAGVKVVFVSKDHKSKILKEHVAFEQLRGKIDEDLAELGSRWYSLMWIGEYRERLSAWRRRLAGDRTASAALTSLFGPATDRVVLAGMAPRAYTLPLLLGASDVRLARDGLTDIPKILDVAAERLEKAKKLGEIDESPDEYLDILQMALSSLSKEFFFYLKPAEDSDPLLVEIPIPDVGMFDGGPTKSFYPQADVEDVVALLLSQYSDPVIYNLWLYQAHEYAAFRQRAEYFGYLVDMFGDLIARRVRMAFEA